VKDKDTDIEISVNRIFDEKNNEQLNMMSNFTKYFATYQDKFNAMSVEQLDRFVLFLINLILYSANKQENEFDKNYFILMSYYIYVLYQLIKQTGESKQTAGGFKIIWRNGQYITVSDDYVLQLGEVDFSENMLHGFNQGQVAINAGNQFMGMGLVTPQSQQMVRDEYSERLDKLQKEHEEKMLIIKQQQEEEFLRARSDIIRGNVPLSAFPSMIFSSIGFGCSSAVCLECSTQLCRNAGQNITQGLREASTLVPGSQLANASFNLLHTIDSLAARGVTDVTENSLRALSEGFYLMYNMASSFFDGPQPTNTVINDALNAANNANINAGVLEEGLWGQINNATILSPDILRTINGAFESLEQFGSRSSVTLGLCMCVTCCCWMYKAQIDKAQQRRSDLILSASQRQLEEQRQRDTMNSYARMAAGAVGGPIGVSAFNMLNPSEQTGLRQRKGGNYKSRRRLKKSKGKTRKVNKKNSVRRRRGVNK
jgi:hypothetical protein